MIDRNSFLVHLPPNAPQMNPAKVVHASCTHRDPTNMTLLDVCMADVRDAVVIEVEMEVFQKRTEKKKTGSRGPFEARRFSGK